MTVTLLFSPCFVRSIVTFGHSPERQISADDDIFTNLFQTLNRRLLYMLLKTKVTATSTSARKRYQTSNLNHPEGPAAKSSKSSTIQKKKNKKKEKRSRRYCHPISGQRRRRCCMGQESLYRRNLQKTTNPATQSKSASFLCRPKEISEAVEHLVSVARTSYPRQSNC